MSTFRNDNLGYFQTRALDQKIPQVLRRKYPELYFASGELLPEFSDLDPGAKQLITEVVQEYGMATVMSGQAQDIPLNTTSVSEDSQPVIAVVTGTSYSMVEVAAANTAMMNGQMVTNIVESRLERMRRSIEEKCHQLGAFGNPKLGMYGLLNNPNVTVTDALSTIRPYLATITDVNAYATEQIEWVSKAITSLEDSSNLVESPNVMLVPSALYRRWATTYRSTNADMTVMEAIMKSNPSLVSIRKIRELRGTDLLANGVRVDNTKDRVVLYTLSAENVNRRVAPTQIMPAQLNKLNYEVYAYKAVAGVSINYPGAFRYVDFPIATTA